jgi:hypothetical protein
LRLKGIIYKAFSVLPCDYIGAWLRGNSLILSG